MTIIRQSYDSFFASVVEGVLFRLRTEWNKDDSQSPWCSLPCSPTLVEILPSIKYRADTKLFNSRRSITKTTVLENVIRKFLSGDECDLNARTELRMQNSLNRYSMACHNYVLAISIKIDVTVGATLPPACSMWNKLLPSKARNYRRGTNSLT